MPTAINEDTGEIFTLDQSGKWQLAKRAKNDQTGEEFYLDGNEWKAAPLSNDDKVVGRAAAAADAVTLGFGDEFLSGVGAVNDLAAADGGQGWLLPTAGAKLSRSYDRRLQELRQIQQRYGNQRPGENLAINVAAGIPTALLTGGGALASVKTIAPKLGAVGQAAGVGSLYGGAVGFGEGEGGVGNRIAGGVIGAGVGGLTGAAVQGVVSPVIGNLARYLKRSPTFVDPDTGNVTPDGMKFVAEYAQRAGLDINDLSDTLQRELAAQAQAAGKARALNPQQMAALADARTLPVRGPMTQGQLTQNPEQFLFESEAAKGRFGEAARAPIANIYSQTQDALEANAQAIRSRIAGLGQGATSATEPGARGQAIQGALANLRDAEKANVDNLFRNARQGKDAAIDGNAYRRGVQNVLQDVAEDFDPDSVPKVTAILGKLAGNAEREGSADALLSGLFRARRNLTSLQGEFGTPDGAAAGKAKRALDQYLIDNMDQAAISGDIGTIQRWKDAISAFKNYATKFEGDDLVQTLTERGNFATSLKVDPVDAVNVIFGRDAIGFVGKGGLTRDLLKIKDMLGDDSAAWKAVKEEAFLRFLRKSDGAMRPTEQAFSGGNFAKAWNDAVEKSPHIIRVLFTKEEQQLISQFARYAQRVTVAPVGGVNTSNTTGAAALFLKKILGSNIVGPKVMAFLESTPILKSLTQVPDAFKAARAAQPRVEMTPVRTQFKNAGEAAALGSSTVTQQINQ
jgi:hypothetical protein